MFKGTEVGDLIFSHFPGQAMGLCAFLTKSLGFLALQANMVRPDYMQYSWPSASAVPVTKHTK